MKHHTASYWTHGVNAISEFPERTINVRRTGYGTIIQQIKGNFPIHNNWFHLPLHTVVIEDQKHSFVHEVIFRLRLNEYVALKEIHIRYGHELIYSANVDISRPDVDELIHLSELELSGIGPKKLQNGLVLCLRFEFLDALYPGEVIFYGAGIRYGLGGGVN